MSVKKIILALSVLTVCSCANLKLDQESAKMVKRVAIMTIEVHQDQPKDALSIGKLKQLSSGPLDQSQELQAMAKSIYETTREQLQERTKWQVVSLDTLINNPEYKKTFDRVMKGPRQISSFSLDSEVITALGTLDLYAFRKLTSIEKATLAKSLDIDAFVEIIIVHSIDQGWAIGNAFGEGAFAFTALATIRAFAVNSETPFWQAQNIKGSETEKSDTLPEGMSKVKKLATLGDRATRSAVEKMAATYIIQ